MDAFHSKDSWVAILLFWNSMITFLYMKETKHRWIDLTALGVFFLHWIGVLIFNESLEIKLFVTVLVMSILVIRLLVARKRKSIG